MQLWHLVLVPLLALAFSQSSQQWMLARLFGTTSTLTTKMPAPTSAAAAAANTTTTGLGTPETWRPVLEALPTLEQTGGVIPSVFLAHGQPMLIYPPEVPIDSSRLAAIGDIQGPNGLLVKFLRDLGPTLVEKYKPKGVVVFSAHWETDQKTEGIKVSDYGAENPLLMDYFGFPEPLYRVKFSSPGSSTLSNRIVSLLRSSSLKASLSPITEPRGEDGRGGSRPGLDHGVFVPFKHMFGDRTELPIVQVSIDSSLSPADEYRLGEAVKPLRKEGYLVITGGLTIHTFRDFSAFSPKTAKQVYKDFEASILDACLQPADKLKAALFSLTFHPGFRLAHPREEHFVPLFVAAGAASGEKATVLSDLHGAKTVIFGV